MQEGRGRWGSAVALLQTIGATGAVPLGIAAATVAVPTAVGLGVAGIVKTCRSFQHEYVSAYEPRDPRTAKSIGSSQQKKSGAMSECVATATRATLATLSVRFDAAESSTTLQDTRSSAEDGTAWPTRQFDALCRRNICVDK